MSTFLPFCPLLPVKADTSWFTLVQSNLKLRTSLSDDFLDKIGFGNSIWWKRRHQFETKQYRPQCLSIDSKLHLLSDKFVGQMCETWAFMDYRGLQKKNYFVHDVKFILLPENLITSALYYYIIIQKVHQHFIVRSRNLGWRGWCKVTHSPKQLNQD